MRYAVFAVLSLVLSGCLLPPAYQIASWTVTGFSYLFTGKSMSDHALSVAMQQDCAIHRVIAGSRVCLLHSGEPVDDLTAVALLGDELEGTAGYPVVLDPVTLPAQMGDLVGVLGAAAKPTTQPDALAVLPLVGTSSHLAQALNDIAPAAGTTDHDKVWRKALSPTPSAAQPPQRIRAANWVASLNAQPSAGGSHYLVIGSFLSAGNAERLSLRHASLGAAVLRTKRGGETWYRVAAGPFARQQLAGAQERLKTAGILKSWALQR
jgi:hypothetical protein